MKKLNLAIIGQGRSGRDIHGKFLKSEDNTLYNVVAIVEADAQRRQRALEEYPGCKVYSDYTELFDVEGIDLVTNATYSEMHYPITKDLLEHGFNVLTEKPFARILSSPIKQRSTIAPRSIVEFCAAIKSTALTSTPIYAPESSVPFWTSDAPSIVVFASILTSRTKRVPTILQPAPIVPIFLRIMVA